MSSLIADPDGVGDTLTVTAADGSAGTVGVVGTVITYTPTGDAPGASDSFVYTVTDGAGLTDTATVTVTITEVNNQPTASAGTLSVTEDGSQTIDVSSLIADPDGDTLTVTAADGSVGTVGVVGTVITYRPTGDAPGASDSFVYTVEDPSGLTATATVTVTITEVNDQPTAVDGSLTVTEGGSQTIDVSSLIADPDGVGDTLTVTIVSEPIAGVTTIDGTVVTYDLSSDAFDVVASGQTVEESIIYRVSDSSGLTATGTIRVVINDGNENPIATNIERSAVVGGASLQLDLGDFVSDPDGDSLTVEIEPSPTLGTATLSGTVLSYTPPATITSNPAQSVVDSVEYRVVDPMSGFALGVVSITLINPDSAEAIAENCAPTIGALPSSACSIEPESPRLKVYAFGLCTESLIPPLTSNEFPESCHLIFDGRDANEQYVTLAGLESDVSFTGDLATPPFATYTHGFLLIDNEIEVKGQLTLSENTSNRYCYIESGMTVGCYSSAQAGSPKYVSDEIENFFGLSPPVYEFDYTADQVNMFLLDMNGVVSVADGSSHRILAVQQLSSPAVFNALTRTVDIGVHISETLLINGTNASTSPFKITFEVQ